MKPNFTPIVAWHNLLMENRGQRARLRRCKRLEEVYFESAYVELVQKLNTANDKIALIAGVLSHAKENYHEPGTCFATQMGKSRTGSQNSPIINRIRFHRLLTMKNEEQLFRLLIRVIKQIGPFDFVQFANDLFYWDKNSTKQAWAYDYFAIQTETTSAGEDA